MTFIALLGFTVLVGLRLWWIPSWYLLRSSDVAHSINEYRAAVGPIFIGMLQGLGGAAILYGLWLNSREHAFTELQHRAQRLKDATTQLESSHPSTRVAAIYELEEIAGTDQPHVARILETLRLHVRNRTAPADAAAPVAGRRLPDDVLTAIAAMERIRLSGIDKQSGELSARFRLDLRGADLRDVVVGGWINDARLDDADLTGVHFTGVHHLRISAPRATFRLARFDGVTWYPSEEGGGLQGADFSGARFQSSTFGWANLKGTVFDGATFQRSTFSHSDLTGASLRNVRFEDRSVFEYNVFPDASMEGTTFRDDSHVHPWQRREFLRARTQPEDYGDMTDTWRAPGEPLAQVIPTEPTG